MTADCQCVAVPGGVDDGQVGAEGEGRAHHDGLGRHCPPDRAQVRRGPLADQRPRPEPGRIRWPR